MAYLFAFLAVSALTAPGEPLAGHIRAAIWSDLRLNAMIGNGNWLGSLWYQASSGDTATPDLHILDLKCRGDERGYDCSFILFRDGGVVTVLREQAPDRLECKAEFVPADEGQSWAIKHIPPRRAGHSRTTMECKAASA